MHENFTPNSENDQLSTAKSALKAGKVFVTGASGLVGSHLVKELVNRGYTVSAFYRSEIPGGFSNDVQWIKGDILDVIALEEAMSGVEQVYHCAAIVSFDPAKKMEMFNTNIDGTANVVNAALDAGVKKLLFVSSVAALGRIREGSEVNETMNWTKETSNSNYGRSKYLAELEVWRGVGEGLPAVVVNPVIIFGKADWNKGSAGMFKSAYNEFPWYTNGSGGFVDVLDVVNGMIQLMQSDIAGQRFIMSGSHQSYRNIFTLMATCFGKKPPHKKATAFLAGIVWRLEAIKGKLSGKSPLVTKETAATAQATVYFNNSKLLKYLPTFNYTPIEQTIDRVCREMEKRYV